MSLRQNRRLRHALAILIPALLGAAVLVGFLLNPQHPNRTAEDRQPQAVHVLAVPKVSYVPRATGYGTARPEWIWNAVSAVPGEVIEVNPAVQTGALLPKDTLLFRIDPTDYRIAIAEAESAIAAHQARLEELDARENALRLSLKIERQRLEVVERDLNRQQTLLKRKAASEAAVDKVRREVLQQKQAVQALENDLAQIPAERKIREGELARETARLARALHDLERTRIRAPEDIRVASVEAEEGQVVRAGEVMMTGDAMAATEVTAQVPLHAFRALVPEDTAGAQRGLGGLTAQVRLRTGGTTAVWSADVDRISDGVDEKTRTVGAVVRVDRPYEHAQPPLQPPLVKGMYVEVQFCAPSRPPATVIPRSALHEGTVYVVSDGSLAIRKVSVAAVYDGFAVIAEGLEQGEQIILTDVVPAVPGLPLNPQPSKEARDALLAMASGEGACP